MKKSLFCILLLFTFIACGKKELEEERFLFGTFIKIKIIEKNKKLAKGAMKKAFSEIERIDKSINSHKKKSSIDLLNELKELNLNKESIALLKEAKKLSYLTKGNYDITINPVFKLWNFGELEAKKIPNNKEIKEALKKVNYNKIKIVESRVKIGKEQSLDTGSFLKGYAIYKARKILEKEGIKNAFISSISSIETIGKNSNKNDWKIGVQNPRKKTLLGKLNITNKALGVSGDYQNYIIYKGKNYHHILNAKTGYPVEDKSLLLILAENSQIADLYSTALFTIGIEEALTIINAKEKMEALIVDKNMNIHYSDNIKKYFIKER